MDSQKFNPKEFVDEVQSLCGILDSEMLQFIEGFACSIGDQSKLNQCIKHAKILVNGLPSDVIQYLFRWIFTVYAYIRAEKHFKPFRDKTYRSITKAQYSHLKKLNRAIELLAEEKPDPSKFDKGYMLNLAKRNTAKRIFVTSYDKNLRDLAKTTDAF